MKLPIPIPSWVINPDDRKDYINGWKARAAGKPRTAGAVDANSRWHNGWMDADKLAKKGKLFA